MSELTQIIGLLYQMQDADVTALETTLVERRTAAWTAELRTLAALHGCTQAAPSAPRREDLQEIRRMSAEDARSIADTWNRQVMTEVERLYADNPRGNRTYYISNLERWNATREQYKSTQIALYTQQSTAYYTANRFRQMNGLRGGRYVYDGVAPVGRVCIERFAAGVVDESYVQRNPTPAHPNCPHTWRELEPEQIGCDEMWAG